MIRQERCSLSVASGSALSVPAAQSAATASSGLPMGHFAARREGAVLDQRALDVLSPGNRGGAHGSRVSGALALGHQRRADVGVPSPRSDDRACGLVLDDDGLVSPLDHRDGRNQLAGGP